MFALNKAKTNTIQKLAFLTGIFSAALLLASASVYADSQSFAINCRLNSPRGTTTASPVPTSDSKGNVSCGKNTPGEAAYITAAGTDASNDTNDTVLVVNCGNNNVKKYKVGDQVSQFKCDHGTPKVTVTQVAGQGSTGSQLCSDASSQNQALCPYCSQNAPPSGCVKPQSDSAATCNGSQCDLVAKYVNPAIGLLSVIFGLLAVISFLLGAINFATSEGDPQKASKAKQRIFNTVFAVVAYIFLYAFLQFLVPGGLFNR